MSRRIDIELTSTREDGAWTWRAAGARQPKGSLDGALLPPEVSVGDVLRAEVETSIDGTTVLSVTPPKGRTPEGDGRIELLTRELRDDELVVETRARRRGRGRGERGERGDRGDRRRGRDGDRRRRSDRDGRGRGRSERGDGDDRRGGPRGDRRERPRRERSEPLRPKAKRLRPARTHRTAALDALDQHERVIAEQVLQGGIPAVRKGVEKMNEQARAQGQPEIKPDALVELAERLLPVLRSAEWRDRADAALADIDELDLRDLRSVVVASEQGARDDETRAMAASLREGLARRVEAEQAKWLADMVQMLEEGRVVRALKLSSRPPKAGAPLPADLATRLAEATSAGLTADTHPDRWITVLDALSYSPVRLTVTPESKPDEPSEDLLAAITRLAGRLPGIAGAFGIEAPPEEPAGRGRGGRRGRSRGGRGRRRDESGAPRTAPAEGSAGSPDDSPAEPAPSEAPASASEPEAAAAPAETAPSEPAPAEAPDTASTASTDGSESPEPAESASAPARGSDTADTETAGAPENAPDSKEGSAEPEAATTDAPENASDPTESPADTEAPDAADDGSA